MQGKQDATFCDLGSRRGKIGSRGAPEKGLGGGRAMLKTGIAGEKSGW